MKSLTIKYILAVSALALITVGLTLAIKNQNQTTRTPSNAENTLSAEKIESIGPLGIIQMLEEQCCEPLIVETVSTKDWQNDQYIKSLQNFLLSEQESSPIVSINSSHSCIGEQYTSSIAREAKHLLIAIENGTYPVSMCSTYDLEIEPGI